MNDFQDVLKYLYSLQNRGVKLGLDRVQKVREVLNRPDETYQTIHVAGTNGKGSTVSYISAILQSQDLRVGWYTSPHLVRFNERIRVNGAPISDEAIVRFIRQCWPRIDEHQLTFFEATTLLALDYFRHQNVDIAVLETGLGGRLDATNVVNPAVTVITSIGFEHSDILGDSLARIAWEKAGIMKSGVPCVLGSLPGEAGQPIQRRASELNVPVIHAERELQPHNIQLTPGGTRFSLTNDQQNYTMRLAMLGRQAVTNAVIALAAVENQNLYSISWQQRRQALRSVVVPGRLQKMQEAPLVYYDVAHNYDGVRNLIQNLQVLYPQKQLSFLINLKVDKDISRFQELFPPETRIFLLDIPGVQMHTTRAWQSVLREKAGRQLGAGQAAIEKFLQHISDSEVGVITGSHYLAPAVYEVFKFSLDT